MYVLFLSERKHSFFGDRSTSLMMNIKRVFYAIGILLCLYGTSTAQEDEYNPYRNDRYDEFDWNLLKAFKSPDTENVIISPFSVKVVLAMLYEGTTGPTELELKKYLSFPISKHATRERFQLVMNSLRQSGEDQTIDIGSRIFLDSALSPDSRFSDNLKKYYESGVESIDFLNPHEAAQIINKWAQNVTHDNVKDLVNADSLHDAVMVLTNALYFRGYWRYPFFRNYTIPGTFHTFDNKGVTAQYMLNYDTYYYYKDKKYDVQFLRLPFKGHISMFIILPNKVSGLKDFIKNITPKELQALRWSMQKEEVDVRIPKFTFNYDSQLKETLKSIGVRNIFNDIPDFTGVVHNVTKEQLRNIKVSDVIQKAGIEINEEGATAFVASAGTLVNKFGGQPIFNASHPFLFYIEDESSGNILFMGKMVNPEKAEKLDALEQILQGKQKIERNYDSRKH